MCVFFVFKQKTAYEMRISDWSSDVCSSDLDTPWGRMGLSICYDLRFPDLYRALTNAGATMLLVPSAFTVPTGQAHWHVLLRARAIEAEIGRASCRERVCQYV